MNVIPSNIGEINRIIPSDLSSNGGALDTESSMRVVVQGLVDGVKGDAEEEYRTGLVNLTPADLGIPDNLVSDPNYVHTDNNYTDADAQKLNGLIRLQVYVNGDAYPVTSFIKKTVLGVEGVSVVYDDGVAPDGVEIFIPDGVGMNDVANQIIGQIPTNVSQLTNDAGYITSAPSKTSELVNDSGFITGADVPSNETDPTVHSWAKQANKPSYTASEVGALPDTTVIPTQTSDLVNDSHFVSDANYVHTDENYTSGEKTKLSGIEDSADVNVIEEVQVNGTALTVTNKSVDVPVPTATSDLNNDSDFIDSTDLATGLAGKADANTDGYAKNAVAIPFGELDATSTATVMTAQVDGITELKSGVCCYLNNGVVTSASGFTLNINGLGAKPVYGTLASATRSTTIFNVAYTMLFVYNETRVSGGCWDVYYGYNSDTNTIAYNVRDGQAYVMKSKLYRYEIMFVDRATGKLIPSNEVSNKPTTYNKALTTDPFDPFRPIFYYSTTSAIEADASPNASYIYKQYSTVDLRYGFNVNNSLTAKQPVFIRCVPQTDKTVTLDGNDCITQTLPSTADGKVYIYLGMAYSTYQINLTLEHPVYYYDANISAVTLWG